MSVETQPIQSLEERILQMNSGEQILRLNDRNMSTLRKVMTGAVLEAQNPKDIVLLLNAAKGFTDALERKMKDGNPANIQLVERVLKAASSLLKEQL